MAQVPMEDIPGDFVSMSINDTYVCPMNAFEMHLESLISNGAVKAL